MKVIFNNKVIAQSNDTVVVEGNHYFPLDSINRSFLEKSDLKTSCVWKGEASYYDLKIDGEVIKNMVWYYPQPIEKAISIKNRIAFYQKLGLKVIEG